MMVSLINFYILDLLSRTLCFIVWGCRYRVLLPRPMRAFKERMSHLMKWKNSNKTILRLAALHVELTYGNIQFHRRLKRISKDRANNYYSFARTGKQVSCLVIAFSFYPSESKIFYSYTIETEFQKLDRPSRLRVQVEWRRWFAA